MRKFIIILIAVLLMPLSSWAATSIPFTITTSEAVNVTGTPRIAVDVGGVTRYATYTSGTGTSSLTFTYTMVAGDVDLDGVTLTSPMQLNGGTIKDLNGNDATLTFTVPNTSNVKVNYPSLGMDFVADADGRYTLNGTIYNDLTSFLSATGGTFTRASVATYFDSSGVMQTAASGTPRFDYDPVTHTAKGILIEENRTNLVRYSSEFETSWIKYNSSILANVAIAPDGTMTADKLVENTATNTQHWVTSSGVNVVAGQKYILTVYAKAAERSSFNNFGSGVFSQSASFNLATGTVVSGIGTIVNVGNGWYRCSNELLANATTSTNVYAAQLINASGTYTGDGTSGIYIWGAQLEEGSFATSYIPTVATTVTRAADNLTIPVGGWFNQPEGSIYSLLISKNITSTQEWAYDFYQAGTSRISAGRKDGGGVTDNEVAFYVQNSADQAWLRHNGIVTADTPYNIASGYKINDFASSSNSSALLTDNSGSLPSPSTLRLGSTATNLYYLNGYIQEFKYYPARVTDTQLQLMTQ